MNKLMTWSMVPMLACCAGPAQSENLPEQEGNKPADRRMPNFIVVLTDDMGYADVGFNGCTDFKTPNIDRIAYEGIRFTNAYVTYSVSSPSRAGLMTGRYEQRFGYERNLQYRPDLTHMGLPLDEMTLAQSLKEVGYTSVAIGKWHLGAHPSFHPNERGFDEFYGFLGGSHKYFPEEFNEALDPYDIYTEDASRHTLMMHNQEMVKTDKYLTDAFSDFAVDFVKKNKDKPFFMYLAYNAPHTPLEVTQEYLDRCPGISDPKRHKYAAMLTAVDDGVGALLDCLDECGLAENTIVYFLSDNGGAITTNGSSSGPLREGKSSAYEGGFRVPFAMRWTGTLPANQVYDQTISSLDIFATAQGITSSPVKHPLDGVNLIPYLTGANPGNPHPTIYLRKWDDKRHTVRKDNYKYLFFDKKEATKPGQSSKPASWQLYDLSKDIGEKNNIIKEHPEIAEELERLRLEWESQLIEPIFEGLKQEKAEGRGAEK